MDIERMTGLLLATIFLPVAGAAAIWLVADQGKAVARQLALLTTLVTTVMAGMLVLRFAPSTDSFAVWTRPWLSGVGLNIQVGLGLDGLSLWLFALSTLLMITSVLISWESISDRPASYYSLLLLLETGMLGVFAARDIILFYVFFEFTLIPLFFLIGIWGSEERRYAAVKFFIYTLAGSLITFLGLISIVLWNSSQPGAVLTFSIPELTAGLAAHPLPAHYQWWLFLALFAGFAIKVPLFPFHTWLPLAHVQAPAAGSVLLAGVLLKLGCYGFLRFSIPWLPIATAQLAPFMLWLSAAGIIYGALVALAQSDLKKLIAYSSVSHLGYCMLGLFALNGVGLSGGVLQLINHGLSTGGLFALVGMIYDRYHTREIRQFGGLTRRLPLLTTMFLFFTFSSIGLPGLNGFAGEFLILTGMFQRAVGPLPSEMAHEFKWIAVLSVFGVVLGAWYMLWLVQRVFFGPLKEPAGHDSGHGHAPIAQAVHAAHATHAGHDAHGHDSHAGHGGDSGHGHGAEAPLPGPFIPDLNLREFFALAPLAVFIVWIGLAPEFFLARIQPKVDEVAAAAEAAFDQEFATPGEKPVVARRDAASEIKHETAVVPTRRTVFMPATHGELTE
jgi:NADH-quinone oxidoreductase subunit M